MLRLCLLLTLLFTPFFNDKAETPLLEKELIIYMPDIKPIKIIKPTKFDHYYKVLGRRESKNNYLAYNKLSGCLGKYQFCRSTIKTVGFIVTDSVFLANNDMQEEAMRRLTKMNYNWLRKNKLLNYAGLEVGGVLINEKGMLAAMHLLGGEALRDYLTRDGNMEEYWKELKNGRKIFIRKKDGLNTTIKDYLNLF